ncbi:MAG: hypothetical protein JXB45_10880, partial [Candidatus Krumholzibacteriota bacterium]|nr:hypothetical protein [Candidatus Krumholzibacteriota bacterium]
MCKRCLVFILFAVVLFTVDAPAIEIDWDDEDYETNHTSLNLAINGYGIGFGNSPRLRGIRINLRDQDVEEVIGINLTFWKPGPNPQADITGLAFGLYGPSADRLAFLPVGLISVNAESSIAGISLGGLAVVSEGTIEGIALGGLATVAEEKASGILLGGLATVCAEGLDGISAGGFASVIDGNLSGITAGGLACVVGGNLEGISASGFASVVDGNLSGITAGGLACVVGGNLEGISA